MKILENVLKKLANVAQTTAVKANGMTSWWDTYQPVEPEAVRKLAEDKRNAGVMKNGIANK